MWQPTTLLQRLAAAGVGWVQVGKYAARPFQRVCIASYISGAAQAARHATGCRRLPQQTAAGERDEVHACACRNLSNDRHVDELAGQGHSLLGTSPSLRPTQSLSKRSSHRANKSIRCSWLRPARPWRAARSCAARGAGGQQQQCAAAAVVAGGVAQQSGWMCKR